MIKKQNEVVTTFRDESGAVMGILVQNGKTEFYRARHANKEDVVQMLEVDMPEEKKL